jgi:hypothetical protein
MAHVAAALRRRHAMAHPWHIRCSTNMFAGIRKRYLTGCFGSPPFVQIRHTSVRDAVVAAAEWVTARRLRRSCPRPLRRGLNHA